MGAVFEGQSIADALGGECSLASNTPGDLRSAEIAKGLTDSGLSVQVQAAAGLFGGFNMAGTGLDIQAGAARPAGWQPDFAPDAPTMQAKTSFDFT